MDHGSRADCSRQRVNFGWALTALVSYVTDTVNVTLEIS
jgi:hypothetical protein